MKLKKIFHLLILIPLSTAHSTTLQNTAKSTHIYTHIAIESSNKIIISNSKFNSKLINSNSFKTPEIGSPIWTITTNDLHVPEEACLAIDATLDYQNNCISSAPEFVAYDENKNLLYLDATSDVSGTGGTPQFLFVADINKREIKYLKTFVGPYTAYLSPDGKHLALETGWSEINICNTQTGDSSEIRADNKYTSGHEQRHGLKFIKWLSNNELKYADIELGANFKTEKTIIIKN